ncbi:MAG: RDD family protein [Pyrinomonadaceae bacterium]|nr:RDD family protein [Pyrinomonadaceae bacterium]
MSARVEEFMPTATKKETEQVVVGFDATRMKAPFLLRCGALLIDYILIVSIPVGSVLLARFLGGDGPKLLNSPISNSGWLIMLLLAITNFFIFPMFSGQSIGKMLTGLRITNTDGTAPGFVSLFVRHVIGYPLTLLTGGLGFLVVAVNKSGRALHDYMCSTTVVYGRKSVRSADVPKGMRSRKKKPLKSKAKGE